MWRMRQKALISAGNEGLLWLSCGSGGGGGSAGAAAVEAAVTQRDAAGVPSGGEPGSGSAGREQARDRVAADMQHLGGQRRVQAAERETAGVTA